MGASPSAALRERERAFSESSSTSANGLQGKAYLGRSFSGFRLPEIRNDSTQTDEAVSYDLFRYMYIDMHIRIIRRPAQNKLVHEDANS